MPPSLHKSGVRYQILKDMPIAPAPEWITALQSVKATRKRSSMGRPSLIPVGRRHNAIRRSILLYATDSIYLTHLWKRAYGLVTKCCELSDDVPFTISELLSICLWAWNKTHPDDRFHPQTAWKLLAGSARNRDDIYFGPESASIYALFPNTLHVHSPPPGPDLHGFICAQKVGFSKYKEDICR